MPLMQERPTEAREKALAVNLDERRYGTFAEIGAGQEVVRWFFRVGGAAGTIAKSISAYDMQVSDAIYGRVARYVCRERLQSMLDYEHDLNLSRLRDQRGDRTAFFAFADTVVARGFNGNHECHGWMGVKFQSHPRDEDSQILIHVRMLDAEATSQQEALGIVGVNLLFGAFFLYHDPDELVESLLDGLSTDRIEIDMIEFSGIEFRHVDNRVMSLRLVQLGLTGAAMFGANGEVLQPSEVLRKRPVVVERGSFRPVTHVNLDMLRAARERFSSQIPAEHGAPISVAEITMNNLRAEGEIDLGDFVSRAEALAATGTPVLISDYFEYYRLAKYLSAQTDRQIGIVLGVLGLEQLFQERFYDHLEGGILESLGRLFRNQIRLYVYPYRDPGTGAFKTLENAQLPKELEPLAAYLVARGNLEALDNYDEASLHIFSREVLRKLRQGEEGWELCVPEPVAAMIRERSLFGYLRDAS